jgi:hypothetical protein
LTDISCRALIGGAKDIAEIFDSIKISSCKDVQVFSTTVALGVKCSEIAAGGMKMRSLFFARLAEYGSSGTIHLLLLVSVLGQLRRLKSFDSLQALDFARTLREARKEWPSTLIS